MSNSSLVCYTKISPNKTSPRNHVIDTITIHCMAGNLTVERCGEVFAPTSRKASSNYGIGSDGRIALYVDESDRSWCSSSSSNDNRAVTIEVANDGGADTGWHVSDQALDSLISLCEDICRRNNIKQLLWRNDKNLIGQIDKQNMTVHRWFANKACPGDYLMNKHSYIVDEVNKRLNISNTQAQQKVQSTISNNLYRVRTNWSDVSSQIGAFSNLDNAKKACKAGYNVYDSNGKCVYSNTVDQIQIKPSVQYYPRYTGNSGSIVEGLKAIGVDSSYSNRKAIAIKNNIPAYSGSALQNMKLLQLLKEGRLVK